MMLAEAGGHIPGARTVGLIREEQVVEGAELTSIMPTKKFAEKAVDAVRVDRDKPRVTARRVWRPRQDSNL